jgi:hypothetical protein
VRISGVCLVNSGPATVDGELTLLKGSALIAAFGTGDSHLTVDEGVSVRSGATLILGCIPTSFPCADDPNPTAPTLSSHSDVSDGLRASQPLGLLIHNSSFKGDISIRGGGGGIPCVPQGIFTQFQSPVYTTLEDNTIRGDVSVTGMQTCWAGFFRNDVRGDVKWTNNTTWDGTPEPPGNPALHGDEDGNELTTNTIHGDLSCFGNVPAIQYGDSQGTPNVVSGETKGQCLAVI